MNLWNVAFVNLPNSEEPKLTYFGGEPIDNRIYSCLVKWKDDSRKVQNGDRNRISIEYLRFDRFLYDANPKDPRVVILAETEDPIADQIEFTTYGQLVIRDGNITEPQELVHQFSDIQHLLALPNLNPNSLLFEDLETHLDDGRPRYYFGYEQRNDIWFGEFQLLGSRNLRRAALAGPIELSRLEPGASEEQTEAALSFYPLIQPPRRFYNKKENPHESLKSSEWRFIMEDPSLVEVRLRPNIFPCSILGVTDEGDVVCFAWRGNYTKPPGYTILQDATIEGKKVTSAASELLRQCPKVKNAILLDEGNDVRHEAYDPTRVGNKLTEFVVDAGNREQVRAVFLFSKKKIK